MSVETAFEKILGRTPTQAEREHLYRIRDALGLRDNDAFWSILIALEYYDSLYREYPKRLADTTLRAISEAQLALARAAELESAKAHRVLSQELARTSFAMAKKLAARPIGVHRISAILASVVAFGTLCTASGYKMASSDKPFWVTSATATPWDHVLSTLLGAPAGWMVLLLLLPVAVHWALAGWKLSHEPGASRRTRTFGWALVSVAIFGALACAIAVVRFT